MLHVKMFISNAVQEIIQTNKNGEFADHVKIKLPWVSEAPGLCYKQGWRLSTASCGLRKAN